MGSSRNLKLTIIPEPLPNSRAILVFQDNAKFKGDHGTDNLECGNCGKILGENIQTEQILNIVIKCTCGSYNEIPVSWKKFRLSDIQTKWSIPIIVIAIVMVVFSQLYPFKIIGIILGIIGVILSGFIQKTIRYFEEQ